MPTWWEPWRIPNCLPREEACHEGILHSFIPAQRPTAKRPRGGRGFARPASIPPSGQFVAQRGGLPQPAWSDNDAFPAGRARIGKSKNISLKAGQKGVAPCLSIC